MYNFLSLFSVVGMVFNFMKFFFRGGSSNSCMKLLEKFNTQFFVIICCGGYGIQFYEIICAGRYSNSCMKLLEKKVRMIRHFILL